MTESDKVASLEREIERLHKELRKRLRQVQGQKRHIEGLEARVQALMSSSSWRITKPWRHVGTVIHRFSANLRKALVPVLLRLIPGGREGLQRYLKRHPGLKAKLRRWSPPGINPELSLFHTTSVPTQLSPIEADIFKRLTELRR